MDLGVGEVGVVGTIPTLSGEEKRRVRWQPQRQDSERSDEALGIWRRKEGGKWIEILSNEIRKYNLTSFLSQKSICN